MPKVSPLPRIYKPLNLVSFSSTHISEVNQGSLGQVVDSGFFASQNWNWTFQMFAGFRIPLVEFQITKPRIPNFTYA